MKNKINQSFAQKMQPLVEEHYKQWLKQEQKINKLESVEYQRECLVNFINWYGNTYHPISQDMIGEEEIDEFLEINK